MVRVESGSQTIGCSEHAILRRNSRERLQRFSRRFFIAGVVGEGIEAGQRDHGYRVSTRSGRILKRLAANVETSHRRRVAGAIEKAAALDITVLFYSDVHGAASDVEITDR